MIIMAAIPAMITMAIAIMTVGIRGAIPAISIIAESLVGGPCVEACMEASLSAGTRM